MPQLCAITLPLIHQRVHGMNNSCLAPHSWLYGRVTRTAQRRKHIHINWEQCAKHFFFFIK